LSELMGRARSTPFLSADNWRALAEETTH
jgi:hypothetical protein